MNQGQLVNRIMDASLRGGALAGGNRDQVKEDLNEAIKWVDALCRPQIQASIEVLVAGQTDYSLSTDFGLSGFTSIREVVYTGTANSTPWSLEETSAAYIRELRQSFVNSNYVNLYALEGLDSFLLYPATQSVGDTITIYGVPRPADLANETDVPTGLPAEFHELYEVATIQRSMRQTSPEIAAAYTQMWEHKLGEYRKWKNRRGGAGPRRSVVGSYGRRLVPHDQSADWRN